MSSSYTGANRGLGCATARRLGRSGVKVIVGARTLAHGEEAADRLRREGVDAEPLQIDVDSAASVQEAAGRVAQRHGRVDILVNNAGILPEATAGDFARWTCACSGRASKPTCSAHQMSKAALNGFTIALSKALRDTSIKVNSICPGWVQTDLGGPENRAAAPTTADEAAQIVVDMASIPDDGPTGRFVDRAGTVAW